MTMSQSALPMLGARRDQMFPTMTQADIDRLRRFGESTFYETGERIVRAGHVAPGLIVILSGKVEVTQGCGPEQRETIVTHLPGNYAGFDPAPRGFVGKRREWPGHHWTRKSCRRIALAGVSCPKRPATSRTRFRQRFLCEDLD